MFEHIGQFKISMHDLILNQCRERMQNLYKILHGFILGYFLLNFQIGPQISFITVFQDQVYIVSSLLDINEPDNIIILTAA